MAKDEERKPLIVSITYLYFIFYFCYILHISTHCCTFSWRRTLRAERQRRWRWWRIRWRWLTPQQHSAAAATLTSHTQSIIIIKVKVKNSSSDRKKHTGILSLLTGVDRFCIIFFWGGGGTIKNKRQMSLLDIFFRMWIVFRTYQVHFNHF